MMMRGNMILRTHRLTLVAATREHVLAELTSRAALAALLAAEVPASWPPGEYDADALEYFRARLTERPDTAGWYGWFILADRPDEPAAWLVGGAGFLGPPGEDGTVEVGYSVIPEVQGRGYTTEAVRALIDFASGSGGVKRVVAHTDATNAASIAVLEKCGFAMVGAGTQAGTQRYERLIGAPAATGR